MKLKCDDPNCGKVVHKSPERGTLYSGEPCPRLECSGTLRKAGSKHYNRKARKRHA